MDGRNLAPPYYSPRNGSYSTLKIQVVQEFLHPLHDYSQGSQMSGQVLTLRGLKVSRLNAVSDS